MKHVLLLGNYRRGTKWFTTSAKTNVNNRDYSQYGVQQPKSRYSSSSSEPKKLNAEEKRKVAEKIVRDLTKHSRFYYG